MTISTGKYYTQMNASSFGTFPNDHFMLGDHLTQVTFGSGSTVYCIHNLHSSIVHSLCTYSHLLIVKALYNQGPRLTFGTYYYYQIQRRATSKLNLKNLLWLPWQPLVNQESKFSTFGHLSKLETSRIVITKQP